MKGLLIMNKSVTITVFLLTLSSLISCTTALVSPYDEKLVTDTEMFYKSAAGLIERGRSVSPLKDSDRSAIANTREHAGHFTKFESQYNQLIIDAEVLILRAMLGSDKINAEGKALQAKASQLVENTIASKCQELSLEFSNASLTAKNYVDLKCIILQWKEQHSSDALTKNTKILKKANWEGRKLQVFNAVLSIQKAEVFKK